MKRTIRSTVWKSLVAALFFLSSAASSPCAAPKLRLKFIEDGKAGYMDLSGRTSIPARFQEGLAYLTPDSGVTVQLDSRWGLID